MADVQIMVPQTEVRAFIAAIDQGARITLVPVPGSPPKVGVSRSVVTAVSDRWDSVLVATLERGAGARIAR